MTLHLLRFNLLILSIAISASFPASHLCAQDIVINEILASNNGFNLDEDGASSDWIEIFNNGNTTVQFGGMSLSDDATLPAKWVFPAVSLAAGEFLLVWASGKNKSVAGSPLHTNFKLSSAGEYVGLYDAAGTRIDGFEFGPQTADISYGRLPDGDPSFELFFQPTPGAQNSRSTPVNGTISFSHNEGVHANAITLALTPSPDNIDLKYTTDGSEPVLSSLDYSSPISISKGTVIRARLFSNGKPASNLITRTFIINEDPQLPVLSIAAHPDDFFDPDSGIYVNYNNRGVEWERKMNATLIENNQTRFSIDGGIRMHGFFTRRLDKKSMRLYFRSEYGQSSLAYKLFDDKNINSFKRLILHAGGQDQPTDRSTWSHIRNTLVVKMWVETGEKSTISAYKPVSMYLNGAYWGMYWLRERIDDNFVESNFDFSTFDLQKPERDTFIPEVEDGDSLAWVNLWDFIENNDISNASDFNKVSDEFIDIANFIQYNLFEIFIGNIDWPHYNYYRVRNRLGNGTFKHIIWDTDQAFHLIESAGHSRNGLAWATRSAPRTDLQFREPEDGSWLWSTVLLRSLLENDEFVTLFANQYADFLNTIFKYENTKRMADEIVAEIKDEMPREMTRWDVSDHGVWQRNLDRVYYFLRNRGSSMTGFMRSKLQLESMASLTLEASPGGTVKINTITPAALPWTGNYFKNLPVPVVATPDPGYQFVGWSDSGMDAGASSTITLSNDQVVRAIFEVRGTTPEIRQINVQNVTPTSATIRWHTAPASISRIEYGLDTNYGSLSPQNEQIVQEHERVLNNLTPSTTYFFRVSATTGQGEEARSEAGSFKTGDAVDVTPPVISDVSTGNITSSSVILRWSTNEPADSQLEYGPTTDYGSKTSYNAALVTDHELAITGLDAGTTYHARALSSDGGGNAAASADFDFTTLAVDVTPPVITNLTISEKTRVSLAVSWETNEPATSQVEYGATEGYGKLSDLHALLANNHKITLTGLEPGSILYFRALSKDGKGNLGVTSLDTVSTLPKIKAGINQISGSVPDEFSLSQNYPNPFVNRTSMKFKLPEPGNLRATIYRLDGREVIRLFDGASGAGHFRISWNGKNNFRQTVGSGIYIVHLHFVTMQGHTFSASRRLLYLK